MATLVPLTFRAAPLPSNFKGTPQRLEDAIVARIYAESEVEIAFFVTGSVAPTSNIGPWLKDGTTWYVWDNITAAYVPQVIAPASLRYIAQEPEPDPLVYIFWIKLNSLGQAISIQYYYAAAWHDVYELKFADYSTTAQMNAAIAAAVTGATQRGYPAQANNNATQVVPIDAAPHKVVLDVSPINSGGAFNTTLSRYSAPQAGFYMVSVESQFDNSGGVAANMQICFDIYINGIGTGKGSCEAVASPPGSRWFPDISGTLISLAQNDYVEIFVTPSDGTNAANLNLTTVRFNIFKIPA